MRAVEEVGTAWRWATRFSFFLPASARPFLLHFNGAGLFCVQHQDFCGIFVW